MSIYRPDPEELHAARLIDGWHIMDRFGPLDGPYASATDAYHAIENARVDDPAIPGRHASYGAG